MILKFNLSEEKSFFIEKLFDPLYYAHKTNQKTFDSSLISNFIDFGLDGNISPNYYFNIDVARAQLEKIPLSKLKYNSVLINWVDQFYVSQDICPTSNFNPIYYNTKYPDVNNSEFSPYVHFILHGIEENRHPTKDVEINREDNVNFDLYNLGDMIPEKYIAVLYSAKNITMMKAFFQPAFYRSQLLEERIILTVEESRDLFLHFINFGMLKGFRPFCAFNSLYYVDKVKDIEGCNDVNVINAFMHWIIKGVDLEIVPTPLFNSDYYLKHNRDLKAWKKWIFIHFLLHGLKEGRPASPYFNSKFYKERKIDKYVLSNVLLENYILNEENEQINPSAECNIFNSKSKFLLKESSRLESFALFCEDKVSRLDHGILNSIIERAYEIEPMVKRPNPFGFRQVQIPSLKHSLAALPGIVREILEELKFSSYENIILIPHCRMAGSAKIAGYISKAISQIRSDEKILVILTDLSVFEKPEWFSDKIEVLFLTEHNSGLTRVNQVLLLLDLIRGFSPVRIINLNSLLCWELVKAYGNPLSKIVDIYTYLFCWDLDAQGRRGGYPIQWFNSTFRFMKGIFVDSNFLKENLDYRYAFSKSHSNKITVLHTPEVDIGLDFSNNLEKRQKQDKKPRCFWFGRFDRQKKFDNLVLVANMLPEIEFSIWGKPVLGDTKFNSATYPDNMIFNGHFKDFETLPFHAYDFYFYTSEWDGLPNALIEVGMTAMPVVSTKNGGVTDLIGPETAFIIEDLDDIEATAKTIRSIYADPLLAGQKGRNLKELTNSLCNWERYNSTLDRVL